MMEYLYVLNMLLVDPPEMDSDFAECKIDMLPMASFYEEEEAKKYAKERTNLLKEGEDNRVWMISRISPGGVRDDKWKEIFIGPQGDVEHERIELDR